MLPGRISETVWEIRITARTGVAFIYRWQGISVNIHTFTACFKHIRKKAGISRDDGEIYQHGIQNLRHTFVTNRLKSWYKKQKGVQGLLPILSSYLGYTNIAHVLVCFSMIFGLLRKMFNRFKNYLGYEWTKEIFGILDKTTPYDGAYQYQNDTNIRQDNESKNQPKYGNPLTKPAVPEK